MRIASFHSVLLFSTLFLAVLLCAPALAGGGPENMILVVNAQSDASKTIANHFIRWRNIPATNVVYLDWKRGRNNCRSDHFRDEILHPVVEQIKQRNLKRQIDYIVYSSDFPWRVDFREEFKKQKIKASPPLASLTGSTYLWHFVELKSPQFVSSSANQYALTAKDAIESRAFRSSYQWANGDIVQSGGRHYVLSTMLGVNQGRGNTVEEILSYLRASVSADESRPSGTFYFMRNNDIRSATRHNLFPRAVNELESLGLRAVVQQGILPKGKKDVLGIMVGTKKFDLDGANLRIQPGAICEHLTSYGGIMSNDSRFSAQTPLSSFLRHGAAGASGAVIEPHADQAKFPLPGMHVHYARGCSLAESFYRSVAAPWQLLVVGDPLCQPWARRPTVTLPGVEPYQTISGTFEITPKVSVAPNRKVRYVALYVDGVLTRARHQSEPFEIDCSQLATGYHELRFVAVDDSPIETQGSAILPVSVRSQQADISFEATPRGVVPINGKLMLRVDAPKARSIHVYQNSRELGSTEGKSLSLQVDAKRLGRGPVVLRAIAKGSETSHARPIEVLIN